MPLVNQLQDFACSNRTQNLPWCYPDKPVYVDMSSSEELYMYCEDCYQTKLAEEQIDEDKTYYL